MSASRTLSRRPDTDPSCPRCGEHWDEATTCSGDSHSDPSRRWWTLPCGHRVVLRVSDLQYPRDP